MKIYIKRCTLAIIMFGVSTVGMTQDFLLEEYFSQLVNTEVVDKTIATSLADWDFSKDCKGSFLKNNINNPALRIEGYDYGQNYIKGYATTKALNYVGDVYLYFLHAKTKSGDKNVNMELFVINGGKFADTGMENKIIPVTKHIGESTATAEQFKIIGTTNNTKIKFETPEKKFFVIDNVIVAKAITITEASDNSTTISTNDSKKVTATITRTLTGGIWNTLCLPFDVTMADMVVALGGNQDIQLRTFSSYADNVMTFVNANATTIPAGTPFLIKLNTTVTDPTFHAVTISNTNAQSIGDEGSVQFVGTYSPVALETDGTNLFITKNNTLAQPAEGMNTMNGLRAYIVVPENLDLSGTRLLMDDGETTAISELAPSVVPTPKATYNLNGQRVENVRRGLYVVNGKLTLVK